MDQIIDVLGTAGFTYRKVASLGKAGSMDVFLDGADASVRDAVHVLWANEKVVPDSIAASPDVGESERVGGIQLIALEALVSMKLTSFRDKDRMHLRDLLSVGLIDVSWKSRFMHPLADRLQQILDDPEG